MYWEIEKAVEELKIRQRQNEELIMKVNKFLGKCCSIPLGFNGFLVRHVASARLEDLELEKRCEMMGLRPIFLEYSEDKFLTTNPSKIRLVRMIVFEGYGRKCPRLQRVYLVNRKELDVLNNLPISQIKTYWEESLVKFHHQTREIVGLKGEIIEISEWLKGIGPAREYYKYLLAACVIRGILFESFESPGFPNLDVFKNQVVLPAWNWVKTNFGYAPLIVRHPDTSSIEEEEMILNWYPSAVLKAIPKKI